MRWERRKTDLQRYTRRMRVPRVHSLEIIPSEARRSDKPPSVFSWMGFPFASVSVLVVLATLFVMSMERGGWSWSSWTYAFSFAIIIPLVALEVKRKAVITGGALILLSFMVLIDAGMPGYLGYSRSDMNWYDNIAHFLGTFGMTLFLWSFICWGLSPTGPPRTNGRRKFWLAIVTMVVVSLFFEFTELFTDIVFGWSNFHPGVDTAGDLIFDLAGILTAGLAIARHRISPITRPFWHAEMHSS